MGKSRRKNPAKSAAPQQAPMESLLDSINNSFTPEVIHRASSMIGEAETATRRALEAAASNVVGGLSRLASSREGVENLRALLEKDGYQSLAGNVPGLFSGSSVTASALSAGGQLLQRLFGREASPVQEQVASACSVKTASAGKLLALVAPLALGLLAKRASAQGLDSSEITRLLTGVDTGAADAAERPLHEAQRGRRWGLTLVPKRHKENVLARPEIPTEPADELPGRDENATAQPEPDSHPLRRIVFVLLALAALALLILLLIRGPVNRRSNHAQPRTLAVTGATPLDHCGTVLRRPARLSF
jgi:hypothetical protein